MELTPEEKDFVNHAFEQIVKKMAETCIESLMTGNDDALRRFHSGLQAAREAKSRITKS